MTTQEKIESVGNEVIDLLIQKNKSYGDSALHPANIFARGNAVENLCARIDDKLMRIKHKGIDGFKEDNVKDLIGYLILLKIALEDDATEHWRELILKREGINPHVGYFQTTT
tara:strand:+ start:5246 stop:5584 length:339 start_codon:yes stop_codon:yes gene_type:complete